MAPTNFELRVVFANGGTNTTPHVTWSSVANQITQLPLNLPWEATVWVVTAQPVPPFVPIVLTGMFPQPGFTAYSVHTLRIVGAAPGTGRAPIQVPSGLTSPLFDMQWVTLELSNLDFVVPADAGIDLIVGRGNRTAVRSCTFEVIGSPRPTPIGVASATNWVQPASLSVEGCLIEKMRTAIRADGEVDVAVSDSVLSQCHTPLLLTGEVSLVMTNSVIEVAELGVSYSQEGPAAVRSRVLDCRFTDCRLGLRAFLAGSLATLEIARSEFSAPAFWRQGLAGPIPDGTRAPASVGMELAHQPSLGSASDGTVTGWVNVNACVSFMLDTAVELPTGKARGRIRVDHCTFDRMTRAGVVVRGDRQAWVPEDRTEFENGHPTAVPPVLLTNNLFLGNSLTLDGRFPPAIELDGAWPAGATPATPTVEAAPPLLIARNAFIGYAARTPVSPGSGDLAPGSGNAIEATGGVSPGGRFYTGAFQYSGTVFENLINVKAGVVRRATFLAPSELAHDYHLAEALGTELLDQSLPEQLPSSSGGLRPLVSGYWGYPSPDGVHLQNRDHWGNARRRVKLLSLGGASLGASERPGFGDFPIIMNNVNETSNILVRQDAGLPYYNYDPPVELMADAASYYSNMAAPSPGPFRTQVEQAFSLGGRVRPLAYLLDEVGLLMLAQFPYANAPGGGSSPGPVLPGVPFAFPGAARGDIGPEFTEWYLPRAEEFVRMIDDEPTLHRVVAGFEAVEETRPNTSGFWRETYFQSRLASMLSSQDREGRGLYMYTPTIDGAGSVPAMVFPAQYMTYPLNGLALGVPPSFDPMLTAQSLLGELGAEDPQERRLLWDDRGFPVTNQQVQAGQQVVVDAANRESVVYDPERPDGDPNSPQGAPPNMDVDPGMTMVPGASSYPAPTLDATNYRPWAATAIFHLSWYPLTDRGGHLLPGSQPMPGNYVDSALTARDQGNNLVPLVQEAPNGLNAPLRDFDRTLATHVVERVASGVASAETVANIHSQSSGPQRTFHALYLTDAIGRVPQSAAHARHDFWAGLHVADALYFHNHARRHTPGVSTPHPAWEAYAECFVLFKSTVREFVAVGERVDIGLEFVAAADMGFGRATVPEPFTSPPNLGYGTAGVRRGPRLGYIPGRPVLRASGFRLGHRAIVFLTNSFEQETSYRFGPALTSGEAIASVTVLLGSSSPSPASVGWEGTFHGIDGEVLELVLA